MEPRTPILALGGHSVGRRRHCFFAPVLGPRVVVGWILARPDRDGAGPVSGPFGRGRVPRLAQIGRAHGCRQRAGHSGDGHPLALVAGGSRQHPGPCCSGNRWGSDGKLLRTRGGVRSTGAPFERRSSGQAKYETTVRQIALPLSSLRCDRRSSVRRWRYHVSPVRQPFVDPNEPPQPRDLRSRSGLPASAEPAAG